jgi:4-amino-4-deoxy-L-arabinose transferase-like glycosyltransferase
VRLLARLRSIDPVLAIALASAVVFSVHGSNWGRVECWNPDQMALRRLSGFRPVSGYAKPPFHTYLTHVLVGWPANRIRALTKVVTGRAANIERLRFVGARAVTIALFLGTVALAFMIARQSSGLTAARIVALLFATSAGFIAYDHFLTCDSPLLFWMLLAFFFAQRVLDSPAWRNYLLAGLVTGLATATKYNGLAVAISLPAAHLLSRNYLCIRGALFDRRLIAGLAMIVVGFFAGCFSALFEWRKFWTDFVYGIVVTPRYGGESGTGYAQFVATVPEIVGIPGALLLLLLICAGAFNGDRRARLGFLTAASVALLYFAKIGAFPRMQTRFVLPAVPFLLLMTAPGLRLASQRMRRAVVLLLAPVLLYDIVCSWLVGSRFASDARLAAQVWFATNLPPAARIESSFSSPHWAKLSALNAAQVQADTADWTQAAGAPVIDIRMPVLTGRAQLFQQMFADNELVRREAAQQEGDADEHLFTHEALVSRNPDFITVHSFDCVSPVAAQRGYYVELLSGNAGYRKVFQRQSESPPRWIYPRDIEFVGGGIVILAKSGR